jgi:hypothetical protein
VGFWEAFRGFSCRAQVGFVVSFVAGLILLGLGFWGELCPPPYWPGWWHKLGYGLNIFAAFTSFLIGLPFAAVILETIKSNAAQNAQIDAVNRISAAAWSDFSDAVNHLCAESRIKALESTDDGLSPIQRVQQEHDSILETIDKCRRQIRARRFTSQAEVTELKEFLGVHVTELQNRRKAVDEHFGTEYKLGREWNYVLSLWQVLDTHVRLRRMEYQLDPMERDSYTRILNDLMQDENPIFQFCKAQHDISTSEKPIAGILGLEARIDGLLSLTDQMIAHTLDQRYAEWFGVGVNDYWSRAFQASMFLTMLKGNVLIVTKSGWPTNATRPKSGTDQPAAKPESKPPASVQASKNVRQDQPESPTDLSQNGG